MGVAVNVKFVWKCEVCTFHNRSSTRIFEDESSDAYRAPQRRRDYSMHYQREYNEDSSAQEEKDDTVGRRRKREATKQRRRKHKVAALSWNERAELYNGEEGVDWR